MRIPLITKEKHSLYIVICVLYFFIILKSIDIAATPIRDLMKMYQLQYPFRIPNKTRIHDLDLITNCECPRIYWPACATDNHTYVNVCIINCLKKTLRRYGPCITYRRALSRKMIILIPSAWKDRGES